MTAGALVLFVAGDPGGAAALLPVINAWPGPKIVLVYRQAAKSYRDAGLEIHALNDETASTAAASDWITQTQASLVVGATSVNGVEWEQHFFVAARELHIPSLALLDYWSNYAPRFTLAEHLDALPDMVAVMDQRACDEMIKAGFPSSRLRITGQPVLDEVRRWRANVDAAQQQQFRQSLTLPSNASVFLFVSQPLLEMRAATGTVTEEEDEFSALTRLSQAVAALPDASKVLLIKLHPRESADKFDGFLSSLPFQARVVNPALHRWEVCLAVDQVWSISSMLLEEARAMGCRVGIIQRGVPIDLQADDHVHEPMVREEMPLATTRIRQLITSITCR